MENAHLSPDLPLNRPQKVGFVSLGCPKNLVDSEVMMGLLARAGAELTRRAEDADVIVVNTCSFIDSAQQESVNTILEMAGHKTAGKAKKLVVAGCLVERYRGDIRQEMPEVDAIIGTNELEKIVALCEGMETGNDPIQPYLYHDLTPRVLSTPHHFAYMKIAEGCDHPCTFCVIPQYRGAFRSRRFESVISEATRLFQQGIREINLIGQDTTCYGEDLGLPDGLADLLARLARIETSTEKWIRFLYAYPKTLDASVLELMAREPRFLPYVDIPLQHVSREILAAMRRGGDPKSYLAMIAGMRETVPDLAIRTTFIVGFPGETDGHFRELCEFVREAEFDNLGVFSYSPEPSSGAEPLGDPVPAEIKEERRAFLLSLQQPIARRRMRRWKGKTVDVLVEGECSETEHLLEGRTAAMAPEIDGRVLINELAEFPVRPGDIVRAKIVETHEYDLVAKVVGRTGFPESPRS